MDARADTPGPLVSDSIDAKARYIARLVQGSQALEASALDAAGYERLVEVTARLLRAGGRQEPAAGR